MKRILFVLVFFVVSHSVSAQLTYGNGTTPYHQFLVSNSGDFRVNGNSSGVLLSSYNSGDLRLGVNGSTRMTFTSSGNVGILTTSPTERLSVMGNIYASGRFISNLGFYATGSDRNLHLLTGTTTRMSILSSNGNVGIGYSTPSASLQVKNQVVISENGAGFGPMLGFAPTASGDFEMALEYNFYEQGKEGLNFWKPYGSGGIGASNYLLFISNNSGFVGVNTNNPTANFTVNGSVLIGDPNVVNMPSPLNYGLIVQNGILTEKVKVALKNTSDWADYVFEKDYLLMPINELSNFVITEKHLPNIQSAKELVEQGGYDVMQMDSKLLEKIEELHLYVIQLYEENQELKERVKDLEVKGELK